MYLTTLGLPFISFFLLFSFGRFIGINGTIRITIIFNSILLFFIHMIFYEIVFNESIVTINLGQWIFSDILYNTYNIRFDNNSIFITYLIILIYSIVSLYSLWYMGSDPYLIRFIGSLNIFCFMMLILVLSNNMLIMLIGWEGVGLTSYFLINFWFTRIQANKSAIKAILYNKIGDIGYILGLILIIINIGNIIQDSIPINNNYIIKNEWNHLILFCFAIAAIAKSAQILLQSWLGDAMEGPTPVSALLHAATMVTAGVFLMLKLLPVFFIDFNPFLFYFLGFIATITIFIGGLASLFQQDIKKIIAYSTMSQLGYMLISSVLGFYSHSYFHLMIHGFFKALLFLSAGIIIHSFLSNEQDTRKLGSLIFNLPLTYFYFIIGTLAIIAWPFFSGFYSKDLLIENSILSFLWIYSFNLFGALFTTIYSIKLISLVFFNKPHKKYIVHPEPFNSLFIILILGSIFFGYYFKDLFLAPTTLSSSSFLFNFNSLDLEFLNFMIIFKILPFIFNLFGIFFGFFFIFKDFFLLKFSSYSFLNSSTSIENSFNRILYWDFFYNSFSKFSLFTFYPYIYLLIDKGFLEFFGPLGFYRKLTIKKEDKMTTTRRIYIISTQSLISLIFISISIYTIFILY